MPSSAAAAGRAGFPTNPVRCKALVSLCVRVPSPDRCCFPRCCRLSVENPSCSLTTATSFVQAETTADGGFNFGRVVKLLTSKHSADDIDRHTHALTRLAKVRLASPWIRRSSTRAPIDPAQGGMSGLGPAGLGVWRAYEPACERSAPSVSHRHRAPPVCSLLIAGGGKLPLNVRTSECSGREACEQFLGFPCSRWPVQTCAVLRGCRVSLCVEMLFLWGTLAAPPEFLCAWHNGRCGGAQRAAAGGSQVHEKTGYRAADISDLATIAEVNTALRCLYPCPSSC